MMVGKMGGRFKVKGGRFQAGDDACRGCPEDSMAMPSLHPRGQVSVGGLLIPHSPMPCFHHAKMSIARVGKKRYVLRKKSALF